MKFNINYTATINEAITITSKKKIIKVAGIKFTTLVDVIKVFQEKGILIETTGYSRNQVFAFQRYIDLFLK